MTTVYVLQHEYEWCGRDESKMIGVYATESDAAAAVDRLREQPGFRDWPDGFSIDPYALGADHWEEGFVILVPVLVPPRSQPGEFQVSHAVSLPGDRYELGTIDDPEAAMFSAGEVVRAEERAVPGHTGPALVAAERLRHGA